MRLRAAYRLFATAKSFWDAYEMATIDMGHGYRRLGTVEFCLSEDVDDNLIFIESIHQRGSKGLGYAGKALRFICDLADIHQVRLKLYVEPIKKNGHIEGLSFIELYQWYKRLGFTACSNNRYSYKVREPK